MERELLFLGLLRRENMHGYQLHEFIQNNLSACMHIKKATAYHLLAKMAQAGWVTETEEQSGNRPPRKVYEITAAGETIFQSYLRKNLKRVYDHTFAGDIGINFLDALPVEEALLYLQERLQGMRKKETEWATIPAHEGHSQLLIEHQRHHLQAEINWLESLIDNLSQS
ncbi:PadR family transcriptional regulator [Anaerolineales bacterium]